MKVKSRFALVLAGLVLSAAASAQQITVSAAASLSDAFKEISARFEAANPGATVRTNFAASGVLLQQIRGGAPADVFASADEETVNKGVAEGLLDNATRRNFASNTLVLVVPVGAAGQAASSVKAVADLGGAEVKRIAIGRPESVPCGLYTKQALTKARLWDAITPKIVQSASVRQVLDYVSRAEVDAGFVYATDAQLMPATVKVVQEVGDHDPITYPVVLVKDSRQPALARAFIDYLSGADAQAILKRYGFTRP